MAAQKNHDRHEIPSSEGKRSHETNVIREDNNINKLIHNNNDDINLDDKVNNSKIIIENQFKSLAKHKSSNKSTTDIQLSKFNKLKSHQKQPLSLNEEGEMIINSSDFNGMGKLNNVNYGDIGMNDIIDDLINDLNDQ